MIIITNDVGERWLNKYKEVMVFMEREHSKPSKDYLLSVKDKQMRCFN